MTDANIDSVYLPFTEDQLRACFAPTKGGGDPDRHLKYYRKSVQGGVDFEANEGGLKASDVLKARARGRQMEKDERFWVVAALMAAFHADDKASRFADLLRAAVGPVPPFEGFVSWEDALAGDLKLYFEVALPAPSSYKAQAAEVLDARVLIPHLKLAAAKNREGRTSFDALLIAPETGVSVAFEAKVLSDASCRTSYDVLRNQLARSIDVLLDDHKNTTLAEPLRARNPDRSCFVLLTPEVFRENRTSRLYGFLYDVYKSASGVEILESHLPHRAGQLAGVPARLGWLTFEDCAQLVPGSCGWLSADVGASG